MTGEIIKLYYTVRSYSVYKKYNFLQKTYLPTRNIKTALVNILKYLLQSKNVKIQFRKYNFFKKVFSSSLLVLKRNYQKA